MVISGSTSMTNKFYNPKIRIPGSMPIKDMLSEEKAFKKKKARFGEVQSVVISRRRLQKPFCVFNTEGNYQPESPNPPKKNNNNSCMSYMNLVIKT